MILLESLELQCVGSAGVLQRVDGAVEVAVLLLEPAQHSPKLANFLAIHRAFLLLSRVGREYLSERRMAQGPESGVWPLHAMRAADAVINSLVLDKVPAQ